MGCSRRRAAVALLALGLGSTAAAAPQSDPRLAAALKALAASDLRVATVAYRLQAAAVPLCRQRIGLSGLIVQDAGQYRADLRPAVAALFGMTDRPTVTGVVRGSPAARAGIRVGDQLVAIDGAPAAGRAVRRSRRAEGARYTAVANRLTAAFARGPVVLTLRRGRRIRAAPVRGTPGCASLVQLDLGSVRNAGADGRTVTISQGLLDFLRSDDELAVVLGHELSHNILGHREAIDTTSRHAAARIRASEREADYYGLYLDAWAGYDIRAAVPFWRRMAAADRRGPRRPGDGSHPGNAARIRALAREIARIGTQRAQRLPLVPDFKPPNFKPVMR